MKNLKIGIVSKFNILGGSERRALEMADGFIKCGKYDSVTIFNISAKQIPATTNAVVINDFFSSPSNYDAFYDCDIVLVINSDSRSLCDVNFWYKNNVDLTKMAAKKMIFLFNFIISPSQFLHKFSELGIDVAIATANRKFFNEISEQKRYSNVTILPRIILESPISGITPNFKVGQNSVLNICSISKPQSDKWNDEIEVLVKNAHDYGWNIKFTFMGMPDSLSSKLLNYPNCVIYKENDLSVSDILCRSDVFMFYPSWKREEPWSRVIAEAMSAGLPIVASERGGTPDQVIHGHNGFLCRTFGDFYDYILYLSKNKAIAAKMGENSFRLSCPFMTFNVVDKFNKFVDIL